MATLFVLARFLAPADFGLMAILVAVTGFCQVFMDAGISYAIIQRQTISHTQLSSLYWLNIASGIVLCGLVYAAAPLIAAFYERPEMTGMMRLLSTVFVIISVGNQYRILCQKELQFARMAIAESAAAIVSFGSAVAAAITGYGVYALIYGFITQALMSSLIFLFVGLKHHHRPALVYDHKSLKGFFGFGLYQMGDRALNYLNNYIDSLLIGRFLGMTALGHYNLAYQLCILPVLRINPILNKIGFPVFSKLQDDPQQRAIYYTNFLRVACLIITPLMIFLFFFSQPIVNIVFGKGWESTAHLALILAPIGIIKAIAAPGGALLLSTGRADIGFYWNAAWLAGIGGTVLAVLMLAPSIENVAYAVLSITIVFSIFWHGLVMRLTAMPYRPVILHLSRSISASVAIGGLAYIISHFAALNSDLLSLLLAGTICAPIYIGYLFFYEKDLIHSYLKKEI